MAKFDMHGALCARGLILETDSLTPLTGGQTNAVWRVRGSVDYICKLYGAPTQNPLYENNPIAEYDCLQLLRGRDLAPRPIDFFDANGVQVLVYDYVQGTQWAKGVEAVASLLTRVHGVNGVAGLRDLPASADALIAKTRNIIAMSGQDFLLDLQPKLRGARTYEHCLVHTDAVSGNIIQTTDGLRLIDWQCPGMGDPIEDYAMFLSPAMQHIYLGRQLGGTQSKAFLDHIPNAARRERYLDFAALYHWRMAAYCGWKAVLGSPDYASAQVLEITALEKLR